MLYWTCEVGKRRYYCHFWHLQRFAAVVDVAALLHYKYVFQQHLDYMSVVSTSRLFYCAY